jgi:hypothetical protein
MVDYLDSQTAFEAEEDTRGHVSLLNDYIFWTLLNGLQHGSDKTQFLAEGVVFDVRADQL